MTDATDQKHEPIMKQGIDFSETGLRARLQATIKALVEDTAPARSDEEKADIDGLQSAFEKSCIEDITSHIATSAYAERVLTGFFAEFPGGAAVSEGVLKHRTGTDADKDGVFGKVVGLVGYVVKDAQWYVVNDAQSFELLTYVADALAADKEFLSHKLESFDALVGMFEGEEYDIACFKAVNDMVDHYKPSEDSFFAAGAVVNQVIGVIQDPSAVMTAVQACMLPSFQKQLESMDKKDALTIIKDTITILDFSSPSAEQKLEALDQVSGKYEGKEFANALAVLADMYTYNYVKKVRKVDSLTAEIAAMDKHYDTKVGTEVLNTVHYTRSNHGYESARRLVAVLGREDVAAQLKAQSKKTRTNILYEARCNGPTVQEDTLAAIIGLGVYNGKALDQFLDTVFDEGEDEKEIHAMATALAQQEVQDDLKKYSKDARTAVIGTYAGLVASSGKNKDQAVRDFHEVLEAYPNSHAYNIAVVFRDAASNFGSSQDISKKVAELKGVLTSDGVKDHVSAMGDSERDSAYTLFAAIASRQAVNKTEKGMFVRTAEVVGSIDPAKLDKATQKLPDSVAKPREYTRQLEKYAA